MTAEPPTTRRRRVYWALLVATPLIAVAALELLVRLMWFPGGVPEPAIGGLSTPRYDQNFGRGRGDLGPDQNAVWTIWPHRPYHVQTNSDGLRNGEEVDEQAVRVLAVGDSFTFGPYVPNEDTWPGWLESLLRTPAGRRKVQVLNAGCSGYTIQDEYLYLAERGVRLRPHLVVLAFYPNDLSDFQGGQREFLSRLPRMEPDGSLWSRFTLGVRPVTRQSALGVLALRGWRRWRTSEAERMRPASAPPAERPAPDIHALSAEGQDAYRHWFGLAVSLLRQHDIPLLFAAIPSLEQLDEPSGSAAPQEFARRLAAEHGVPFLDTLPFLRTRGGPEDLYLVQREPGDGSARSYRGNGHMTGFGYRTVALAIAARLHEDDGLLRVER